MRTRGSIFFSAAAVGVRFYGRDSFPVFVKLPFAEHRRLLTCKQVQQRAPHLRRIDIMLNK